MLFLLALVCKAAWAEPVRLHLRTDPAPVSVYRIVPNAPPTLLGNGPTLTFERTPALEVRFEHPDCLPQTAVLDLPASQTEFDYPPGGQTLRLTRRPAHSWWPALLALIPIYLMLALRQARRNQRKAQSTRFQPHLAQSRSAGAIE